MINSKTMPSLSESCILLSMNARTILHIDMDAFFAAVEVVLNPKLKGKPVIVGGSPDQRGVVSTCSYEARAFGVRSAMAMSEAVKRCPHGVFIHGNYEAYRTYSRQIVEILRRFSDKIEMFSIDEAYMDASEIISLYGNGKNLGDVIRRQIFEETKLCCSIGVGANKLVAKIGSGLAKPNGLYDIPQGQEAVFLAPLPIEMLPGIGEKTKIALNREGFSQIKDLQKEELYTLIARFGARGYLFYYEAHGRDERPVVFGDTAPKSIGAETTFDKDSANREFLTETLRELTLKAWTRLKKHKMRARGLSIKIRYNDFRTTNRSHTFHNDENRFEKLWEATLSLFERSYQGNSPLRLIGIAFEKLNDGYWQPTFWDD